MAELLLAAPDGAAEAQKLLEPIAKDDAAEPSLRKAALYRLGVAFDRLKQLEQVSATFAAYAKAYPDDAETPNALLQAASADIALGRLEQGITRLTELLEKAPKHPQAALALLKRGEAQADANLFADAQASHERFLKEFPDHPQAFRARFGLGWALENQGSLEKARQAYEQVTAGGSGPTAARAQFQIGETYLAEGNFEKAALTLLVVEDVYNYPEWSARALYEAGRAFQQLKQYDNARQQYQLIVAKYASQNEEAKLAQARLDELKKLAVNAGT